MSKHAFLPGQLRLILAITSVHLVAWFAYYSQIPAGQYPSDEARTTLDAALALAAGMPSEDSGHSLYTYTLSILAHFFGDAASLTNAARGLNALALIFATGFCASAAGHYWRRNRAVWIAGLLVGLNPVLIFWAGEVSPGLLATVCISAALWRILPWLRHPKGRDSIWIAVCLSLAATFETSLLPFAPLWPALAFFYTSRERVMHLVFSLIPPVVVGGLIIVSRLHLQDPLQWNTDQIGLGIYQALGSQETYDGKSFSLYRQLHLILFLNPIHWGILFILAGLGSYARLKDGHRGRSILMAVSVLAIFALSFALTESGSQARASLIPLLAVFAAGVALIPKIWTHAGKLTRRKIILGSVALTLFAYAGYWGPPQSKTWERDYIYLAEANIRLGDNDRATTWAEKALELNPASVEMQEILVIAQFNDWAMGNKPSTLPIETAKEYLMVSQKGEDTPIVLSIEAIYHYKLRNIEQANTLWQSLRQDSALALLCLYWTGSVTELTDRDIAAYSNTSYYELLDKARQIDRSALEYGSVEKQLDNMLAFAY